MILDIKGDLVWFHATPPGSALFNLRPQTYQGKAVVTWWYGHTGPHYGQGAYTVADNSYRTIATVPGAQGLPGDFHEFLITAEDTALFTAFEATKAGGQLILEGVAFEVDVATAKPVFSWRSFGAGHVGLSESYISRPTSLTSPWDYFHINSVAFWPGPERDLLISARNSCAIYSVSRETGQIVWRLGGKNSDFEMNDLTRFWWQHDARALSDGSGLSLFDDASDPVERANGDPQSRGMVLTFQPGGNSVSLRHEFVHSDTAPSANEAGIMGNCQLLPTGGYFVGWGGEMPYFSGFGSPGSARTTPLVPDGRFPDSWFSYRSYAADWVGHPPVDELAVKVKPANTSSDRWEAYASWNGATDVASWVLLAGTSADNLTKKGVSARTGFETAMSVTAAGASVSSTPFFQVQALDGTGKVLGVSEIVRAT